MNALKSRPIANVLLVLMLAQSGLTFARTSLASEQGFVSPPPPPPPDEPIVPTN